MEMLQIILDSLAAVPEWVSLYVVPALVAVSAVGFIFTEKRKWYCAAAVVLVAAGFLFAYAVNAALSLIYLGLISAFAALVSLLFLIPVPKRGKRRTREERIFEKFHEELSEKPYKPRSAMPPKVCCFERENGATAEEYGMSLSYADTLLEKLRLKKLNAGDRLETEELLSRLDCYRNKPLNEAEHSSLNDCLASILKLTAKYQL